VRLKPPPRLAGISDPSRDFPVDNRDERERCSRRIVLPADASLHPRKTVRDLVGVGLKLHGLATGYEVDERVLANPEGVGLGLDHDVPKIPRMLAERGYAPDAIDMIMGENFLRVFRAAAGG